ncbi:MAG: tetratricopeptide repeat protein [Kiritimatiellales bacterium]|jgi:tetratricopeptide (TPR) repeat protein
MKYLLPILTAALLGASSMAQNAPQGPSPLAISVYETASNTTAQAETNVAKGLPQGSSPLIVSAYGETTNVAVQTGIAVPSTPQGSVPLVTGAYDESTNTVVQTDAASREDKLKAARVSFLMDTGVQYANEGEYKEAEQAYLHALQADPNNGDLYFRLSMLYIQMERYEDAVMLLKRLEASIPGNPMIQNNLAWIYATGGKMKNGKLALRHAREAIMDAPYAPSLWNTLAEAYYVSGQYDKALRSSGFAMELLKMQQNASKQDIASFEAQHAKIQRAYESYKGLLRLEDEK